MTDEEKKILMEKPPPIRKMDDMVIDKDGNMVDAKTGKILVSKDQRKNLVKDKFGNLIDATTGEVVFDKDGNLMADKKAAAAFIAKKEAVKAAIVERQIREA